MYIHASLNLYHSVFMPNEFSELNLVKKLVKKQNIFLSNSNETIMFSKLFITQY